MATALQLRPDLTDYELSAVLDGVTFVLRLRWSDEEESWYLDIMDAERVAIAMGLKVVIGPKLGCRRVDVRMPAGALIAVDTSKQDAAPGLEDLGDRVQILYVPEAEWSS